MILESQGSCSYWGQQNQSYINQPEAGVSDGVPAINLIPNHLYTLEKSAVTSSCLSIPSVFFKNVLVSKRYQD